MELWQGNMVRSAQLGFGRLPVMKPMSPFPSYPLNLGRLWWEGAVNQVHILGSALNPSSPNIRRRFLVRR